MYGRVSIIGQVVAASLLMASGLFAQDAASRPAWVTGPSLGEVSWVGAAVRRAEALGLVEHLSAQRTLSLEEADRVLGGARDSAVGDRSWMIPLADRWRGRLRREYPRVVEGGGLTGRARVGFLHSGGAVAPGFGEFEPNRTGAVEIADEDAPLVSLDIAAALGPYVGARVKTSLQPELELLDEVEVAAGWRSFRFSAGRVRVGYGFGYSGGVTLTGSAPLEVVQVGTRAPIVLPSVLGWIGPVALHTFAGRMREERHPDEPYIWGGAFAFQPHRRLSFGVHRAAMFGGGGDQPVTAGRILDMLVGRVANIGFENQIVSVSGKLILPTERTLPVEVYAEWGAEDAAGAWFDVPGIVMGVWTPAFPAFPGLAVGFEFTELATSCCSNPSWYRHWSFNGSWASGSETLGHPLGGDGRQISMFALVDAADGSLWMNAHLYHRERRDENLYSPGRTGTSHGADLSLEGELRPNVRLLAETSTEWGRGWTSVELSLTGSVIY